MNEFESIDTTFTRLYFAHTKEMVLMVKNDSIAVNISAITGVHYDVILKEHSCVGLSATTDRLNSIYEFVCAGGRYEGYGKGE